MKKSAFFGFALIAGMVFSSSFAPPANAQMLDVLKNALGGQIPGLGNSAAYGNSGYYAPNNSLLPGGNSPYYNAPATGNGIVNSLLPLVQNSSIGSGLLNQLSQSQYGALGAASPTDFSNNLSNYLNNPNYSNNAGCANNQNFSSNYGGGLANFGNFGNVQPVVYNGVTLDSSIYSGPYKGTSNQMESAMNLDWAMTVLKEQITLGASQGYLTSSDANAFGSELNNLIAQKRHVVRRNGLSFEDSQEMVAQINDLVGRVRNAWYQSSAYDNGYGGGNGWGRHNHGRYAQASAYGQILNSGKNQALENLYLKTQPVQGFGR